MTAKTTPHNHGPNFGRIVTGCARCDELAKGAAPVAQSWRGNKARQEAARVAAIKAHDCKRSGCSFVCTFGDW